MNVAKISLTTKIKLQLYQQKTYINKRMKISTEQHHMEIQEAYDIVYDEKMDVSH